MAIGTDTLVHNTCLKYKGKTIAVLPCGFNRIYPKQNKELLKKIIDENGLILTEYEDDVKATYTTFLERNRIVAGLGKGLLVIEALYRSGTSVTAKFAFKMNKKVCAIPRKPGNAYSVGTNNLIRNGAYLITSVKDILEVLPEFSNRKIRNIKAKNTNRQVKEEYRQIYYCLKNEFINVDKISEMSGKDIRETIEILTLMEIDGLVEFEIGRGYKKKEEEV